MSNNDESYKMKITDDRKTVNVIEFARFLFKKLFFVILVGILFGVLAFGLSKFVLTPKYEAETKVYVLNNSNNNNAESIITTSDLQVGNYLTKDYMELVKSRPVLEHTIKKLNLDISQDKLKSMITLDAPADTRILCIKVTSQDPELSKNIADTVREAAGKQICSIMNADAVNVVETAALPEKPVSPNIILNTIIGILLGFVFTVAVIFIIFISDDSIKSVDDVEKYLGLTTLTTIPEITKKSIKKNYISGKSSYKKESDLNSSIEKRNEDLYDYISYEEQGNTKYANDNMNV